MDSYKFLDLIDKQFNKINCKNVGYFQCKGCLNIFHATNEQFNSYQGMRNHLEENKGCLIPNIWKG